jgi:hypothetical protein
VFWSTSTISNVTIEMTRLVVAMSVVSNPTRTRNAATMKAHWLPVHFATHVANEENEWSKPRGRSSSAFFG